MKPALLILTLALLAAPAMAEVYCPELHSLTECIDCDKDELGCLAHWHLDHDHPKPSDDYFIVLQCHHVYPMHDSKPDYSQPSQICYEYDPTSNAKDEPR